MSSIYYNRHVNPEVAGLIATKPRLDLLLGRALPSIETQTTRLNFLVIVCDKETLSAKHEETIQEMLSVKTVFLTNQGKAGAAGSWNTGLKYIEQQSPNCYTAIIDDDDSWDADHLTVCMNAARENNWPDIVFSGLRMIKGGMEIPRQLPESLSSTDFLAGNPGWQGSNTFVKLQSLIRARSFTEGLISSNDRDLAIRMLDMRGVRVAYTRRFSASWFCGESIEALSAPKSEQKLTGLAQFYLLYRHRMNCPEIEKQFFKRAEKLFGFSKSVLLSKVNDLSGKQDRSSAV